MAILVGVSLGSFINVVVIRLAAQEKISGRSHCRSCGQQLAWYHNIPLLSYLWLKGKCAYCRQHISWQYPLVEASVAVLFLLGVYLMPPADYLWLITFIALVIYSVMLFVFDLRFKVLPDVLTLSGAVVLLLLNLWRGLSIVDLVLSAAVAAGFFALQYLISRGRWIGSGDIRLGLLIGFALSWPGTLVALVIAYWFGALTGILLMIFKNYRVDAQLPFGTFLTAGTVVVFLFGGWLVNSYLSFVGF
jgi:leader peptidase (prepilin peptidase) / N-methyltransferase